MEGVFNDVPNMSFNSIILTKEKGKFIPSKFETFEEENYFQFSAEFPVFNYNSQKSTISSKDVTTYFERMKTILGVLLKEHDSKRGIYEWYFLKFLKQDISKVKVNVEIKKNLLEKNYNSEELEKKLDGFYEIRSENSRHKAQNRIEWKTKEVAAVYESKVFNGVDLILDNDYNTNKKKLLELEEYIKKIELFPRFQKYSIPIVVVCSGLLNDMSKYKKKEGDFKYLRRIHVRKTKAKYIAKAYLENEEDLSVELKIKLEEIEKKKIIFQNIKMSTLKKYFHDETGIIKRENVIKIIKDFDYSLEINDILSENVMEISITDLLEKLNEYQKESIELGDFCVLYKRVYKELKKKDKVSKNLHLVNFLEKALIYTKNCIAAKYVDVGDKVLSKLKQNLSHFFEESIGYIEGEFRVAKKKIYKNLGLNDEESEFFFNLQSGLVICNSNINFFTICRKDGTYDPKNLFNQELFMFDRNIEFESFYEQRKNFGNERVTKFLEGFKKIKEDYLSHIEKGNGLIFHKKDFKGNLFHFNKHHAKNLGDGLIPFSYHPNDKMDIENGKDDLMEVEDDFFKQEK